MNVCKELAIWLAHLFAILLILWATLGLGELILMAMAML